MGTLSTRVDDDVEAAVGELASETGFSQSQLQRRILEGYLAGEANLDLLPDDLALELKNNRRQRESRQVKRASYFEQNVRNEVDQLLDARADPEEVEDIIDIRRDEADDFLKHDVITDERCGELQSFLDDVVDRYSQAYQLVARYQPEPLSDRRDVEEAEDYLTTVQLRAENNVFEALERHDSVQDIERSLRRAYDAMGDILPEGLGQQEFVDDVLYEAYRQAIEDDVTLDLSVTGEAEVSATTLERLHPYGVDIGTVQQHMETGEVPEQHEAKKQGHDDEET